jgi:hypothetical protein
LCSTLRGARLVGSRTGVVWFCLVRVLFFVRGHVGWFLGHEVRCLIPVSYRTIIVCVCVCAGVYGPGTCGLTLKWCPILLWLREECVLALHVLLPFVLKFSFDLVY